MQRRRAQATTHRGRRRDERPSQEDGNARTAIAPANMSATPSKMSHPQRSCCRAATIAKTPSTSMYAANKRTSARIVAAGITSAMTPTAMPRKPIIARTHQFRPSAAFNVARPSGSANNVLSDQLIAGGHCSLLLAFDFFLLPWFRTRGSTPLLPFGIKIAYVR